MVNTVSRIIIASGNPGFETTPCAIYVYIYIYMHCCIYRRKGDGFEELGVGLFGLGMHPPRIRLFDKSAEGILFCRIEQSSSRVPCQYSLDEAQPWLEE